MAGATGLTPLRSAADGKAWIKKPQGLASARGQVKAEVCEALSLVHTSMPRTGTVQQSAPGVDHAAGQSRID